MTDPKDNAEAQFIDRVQRRIRFLKVLKDIGMGLYLPADDHARKHLLDQLTRMTARQSELPLLSPTILAQAGELFRSNIEAMQGVLPHDVQYRNRIRRNW